MKVLLTGTRGFLGTNLKNFIEKHRAWDVVCLQSNLLDLPALTDEIGRQRPEILINCAAKVGAVRSFQAAPEYLRINIEGTSNLLEASRKAGLRRFVQVSTIEVYGSCFFPTEKNPLRPESPYAVSKAAADMLVAAAGRHGLETIIVRSTYSYGLYDRPHRMLPFFVKLAAEDQTIPLYGDGLQVRDWMHVEDTAAGILLAAERGMPWETYNLGSANLRNNKELALRILEILGKSPGQIKHVDDLPGHGRFHAADFKKASEEIGFKPKVKFIPAFEEAVKSYAPGTSLA